MVGMDKGYYRLLKRNYKTARNRDLYTSLGIQGGSALLGFLGNMYAQNQRRKSLEGAFGLGQQQQAQLDPSNGGSQLQGPTPSGVPLNVATDAENMRAQAAERNPLGVTPEMADLASESEASTMNLLQASMMARKERQSFNERMILADLHEKAQDDRAARREEAMMARLDQQNGFQIQRENWRAVLDVGKEYAKAKLGIGGSGGQQKMRPEDIPDEVVKYHVEEARKHGEAEMTDNVMRDRLANGTAGARTMYPEADIRERTRDESGFMGLLRTVLQGRQKTAFPGDTINPTEVAGEANAYMQAGHKVRQPPQAAPASAPSSGIPFQTTDIEWGGGASQPSMPPPGGPAITPQVLQRYEKEPDPAKKAQMRQFIIDNFKFDPEG